MVLGHSIIVIESLRFNKYDWRFGTKKNEEFY